MMLSAFLTISNSFNKRRGTLFPEEVFLGEEQFIYRLEQKSCIKLKMQKCKST